MTDDDRHVRPFAEFLVAHRKGMLHDELSDALNAMAESVRELDGAAKLTITITMKPAAKLAGDIVEIADTVKVVLPEPARGSALWWVDGAGNLSRRDPNQPELPLRVVDPATGEITDTEQKEHHA